MAFDERIAERLAERRLVEWRQLGYDRWRAMLDDRDSRRVDGPDGRAYTVVSYALDDGDGRIRLVVAVDDGGRSAYSPLTRDEIMRPDGTFVD